MANKFTVVKKGYDINEVEEYIRKLEKEIDSFRGREVAISKSLINAEVAASETVGEAEKKAKELINNAHGEIDSELDAVERMIGSERKALDDFCYEYDSLVKNYFTGSAQDITAPLREKINLLESIVKEKRQSLENDENTVEDAGETEAAEDSVEGGDAL